MKAKKILALAMMTGALTLCVTACGDKKDGTTSAPAGDTQVQTAAASTEATEVQTEAEPAGKMESWGDYTEILVPDGMELAGGSTIKKDDPKTVSLQTEGDYTNYYMFTIREKTFMSDAGKTKEINQDYNPQDVTLQVGDVTWTGVTYKYDGTLDCTQMFAQIDGKYVNVNISGNAYDSEKTKAVLASIRIK